MNNFFLLKLCLYISIRINPVIVLAIQGSNYEKLNLVTAIITFLSSLIGLYLAIRKVNTNKD